MPAKSKRSKNIKKKSKSARVEPIPPGFNTITPHLAIKGAAEAIEFYKKAFGAKEFERERQLTPDGKVVHARIKIGDSFVMMADVFPGSPLKDPMSAGMSTVTLHIYSKNVDKLWEQATSAGAKVTMPLDNQFWGDRYGQLQDPFGHQWSLGQKVKMSPKEMKEKQEQAMKMFSQGHHAARTEETEVPPTTL
jgi:PhnB protein